MNKIPTVFLRDPDNRRYVTTEVNPACAWVLAGEGTPRRKYDGTCVLVQNGDVLAIWTRREVKAGKSAPADFIEVERDETTGKIVGWEPWLNSSFAQFITEAKKVWAEEHPLPDPWRSDPPSGTYELIGPKINGNPGGVDRHRFVPHRTAMTPDDLYDASVGNNTEPWALVRFLGRKYGWEGLVWHHPDGRMAKLKARDLPRVGK